jgi:hypothetical protein
MGALFSCCKEEAAENGQHSDASNSAQLVSVPSKSPIRSNVIQISRPGGSSSSSLIKSNFYNDFDLKEQIGTGSTSACYKCIRRSDGQQLACKVIEKRNVEEKFSGLLDQFFIEIKVLRMVIF